MGILTEDMTRLAGEIGTLRAARQVSMDDLARGEKDLKDSVTDMQDGFRNAHSEMAARTKDELGTFVSGLKHSVGEMQAGFGNAHVEMATEMKADLSGFISNLKERVAGLRRRFREDMAGARHAWSGLSSAGRKARKESKGKGPKRFPDDLTAIPGIGPAMQKRLNQAGIHTYAQFAAKSPKDLSGTSGRLGSLADMKNWITQARELASS